MNDIGGAGNAGKTKAITVIGLGEMGTAIATRLINEGCDVTVWNRSAKKSDALAGLGARKSDHLLDAIIPGGRLITVLADDNAVDEVVLESGVLEKLGHDGLHISVSTISPDMARKQAEVASGFGGLTVSSPVMGRPVKALEGNLWCLVSGANEALELAEPILRVFAQNVSSFGDDPAAAPVAKLAMNFMGAVAIESIGEACALVDRYGIDRRTLISFMTESVFNSYNYKLYGSHIAENNYDPAGFRIDLGWKDINLVLNAAASGAVPMPFASVLRDRLLGMIASGRGALDWTAIALAAMETAGIKEQAEKPQYKSKQGG